MPVLDVLCSKPGPVPSALGRWKRGGGSADANQQLTGFCGMEPTWPKTIWQQGGERCWMVLWC